MNRSTCFEEEDVRHLNDGGEVVLCSWSMIEQANAERLSFKVQREWANRNHTLSEQVLPLG